jgi:tetratricopeptide (TPR) repeat protein
MDRLTLRLAVPILGALLAWPAIGAANPQSALLRARAATEFYSLDHDLAAATYREAIAADPEDAAAYRGLAGTVWVSISFIRGTMTVDSYLGRATRKDVSMLPPPTAVSTAFNEAIDRAIALSRKKLTAHPRDADAQYELGAAIGLRASYIATVDGGVLGAFRAAREAYDAHETVLELNPQRYDAGLIVGTYRYLVAVLSLPLRWAAYMAGFGGGRQKGLELIGRAANYPGDNQADAKIALVLLYNREAQYDEALKQLDSLRAQYPRNRLLWLETGSTLLRASRPAEAERALTEGMARHAADNRKPMFGEDALWYYKRGFAWARLGRAADARQELQKALSSDGRQWVHGRAHFELGKLALGRGDRDGGIRELRAAISLCEADGDGTTADEARRLIR